MQCFYCISAQGGELVAITGPLPNKYFIFIFHFRLMEASQNKSDVTIQFLVCGLVIHFAGIFHLSCSVQKLFKIFMFV
jgi:hypothetical protein